MYRKRVSYIALAAFLSVVSCSQEATEPDIYDWTEETIFFKTSLSDVRASRAQEMTFDRLASFQATCFNTTGIETNVQGQVSPYFENTTFFRKTNSGVGIYESAETYGWPSNNGLLRFFAFSPSQELMAANNSALEGKDKSLYFNLINNSTVAGSDVLVDYRLGTVRINPDISHQFDFITAEATGKQKDFIGGVDIAFSHQLCQIELDAWGDNGIFNIDIAGVRIGNPVVEGTFVFADYATPGNTGTWAIPENSIKDKVEYIYRSAETSASEGLPGVGDKIFKINRTEHNTPDAAASIMGQGGCAMVLPTVNSGWEGLNDPNIENTPYATDKMYFSILMRISSADAGSVMYPYSEGNYGMKVVSYAVDSSGVIRKRLYAGETPGTYFTDAALRNPYVPDVNDQTEIMDFGWSAVAVDADWKSGRRYIYTLDYSNGFGWHDPSDPNPGEPITFDDIEHSVSIKVTVADWKEGPSTDVAVPRR